MRKIIYIAFAIFDVLGMMGCRFMEEKCEYTAVVDFSYYDQMKNEVFDNNINTMTDFLFDSNDRLIEVYYVPKTTADFRTRRMKLSGGKYTLIRWGNINQNNIIRDYHLGKTTLAQMEHILYGQSNQTGKYPNSPRMFFAQTELFIEDNKTAMYNVQMSNAHIEIYFLVKWNTGQPAPRDITLDIDAAQGGYTFSSRAVGTGVLRMPNSNDTKIDYRSPVWNFNQFNERSHVFLGYRWNSASKPMLTIRKGEKNLFTPIDLAKHLTQTMGEDLDNYPFQQYDIMIDVRADRVVISQLTMDWEDGGSWGKAI